MKRKPHYEYWKAGKYWRWHYKAGNGEIVACGEGYSRRIDMMRAVKLLQSSQGCEIRRVP
jgi:uncharacterized protein YegP (UPF0339 family)